VIKTNRTVKWLLFVLLAAVCTWVTIYGPTVFAVKEDEDISPKGYYRLEYMIPGFPYLFSMTTSMPRFVRLYDNRSGELLGESEIVELSGNGRIFWPSKYSSRIRVGVDVQFFVPPEPD
jgi:hypothetical protein